MSALMDAPLTSAEHERIEPVRRAVPLRRPQSGPPRGAVVSAVLAAVLSVVVGVAAGGPVDETWSLVSGALAAEGVEFSTGDEVPFEVVVTALDDGAVVESDLGRISLSQRTVATLSPPRPASTGSLSLTSGQVLVEAELGAYTVRATLGTVTGTGTFRVERDDSPRVAVYAGTAAVLGDRNLVAGRLAEVALDGTATRDRPIVLDADDPWDAVHGAAALETDQQVAQLRQGLERTYGTSPQTPEFYGDFVGVTPGLEVALASLSTRVDGRLFGPPADTLVAAAVIETLRVGTALPIDQVINTVLPLRADGGTWGVILARFDLDAAQLRDVADDALRRRAAQGEDAEPVIDPPSRQGPARPQPPEQPQPQPPEQPQPSPSPSPTPEPDPSPSIPPPTPEPPPEPGPIEDTIGTIGDLLEPGDGPLPLPDPGGVVNGLLGADGVVSRLLGALGLLRSR